MSKNKLKVYLFLSSLLSTISYAVEDDYSCKTVPDTKNTAVYVNGQQVYVIEGGQYMDKDQEVQSVKSWLSNNDTYTDTQKSKILDAVAILNISG